MPLENSSASGNKNMLMPEHQEKVLAAFTDRQDIDHFAHSVPAETIADNDYSLSVSSYVEQKDDREEIDIVELNTEIAGIVARQSELKTQIDAIVADLEKA